MATNNAVNTSLSGQTGTGSFAGSTSPSFTTPVLGTPTSGNLSNCTSYPFSALSGTISAAQMITLGNSGMSSLAGSVTYDLTTASGNQTITGLAFQPSLVIFWANVNAGSPMSIGADNGGQQFCIYDNNAASANSYGNLASDSIVLLTAAGAYQSANISSFTSDGFVLSWVKTGAPSGTADIRFLAFK